MSEKIYPRSPKEMMSGWIHLPRLIDKIRLHLAGKLHPDYQDNFTEGFDGLWLAAAGLKAEDFINVVKSTITDGQVGDWVRENVRKTQAEKEELARLILTRGNDTDERKARLKQRKEAYGISDRDDVKSFADLIEFDEKRL